MSKLELFRKYLSYKRAYYAGSPIIGDYEYDMFEQSCRNQFPEDDDFYLSGYGDLHERRLEELENETT